MVLYYLFGYYVAWQNPDVRTFYAGSTGAEESLQQMCSIAAATPWMLPLQFGRGLLWALFAYPVVRMLKTSRLETACTISALFGVWSFVLLLPNPLMSPSVTRSHLGYPMVRSDSRRNRRMGTCRKNARGRIQPGKVSRDTLMEVKWPFGCT